MAVFWGDILIGAASFIAGVYFADVVKAPVMKFIGGVKSLLGWIGAKF